MIQWSEALWTAAVHCSFHENADRGHLEKVRQIAKQCVVHYARMLIDRLNPVLRGWAN